MTSEVYVGREMEPRRDLPLNKLLDNLSSYLCGASEQACKGLLKFNNSLIYRAWLPTDPTQ